MQKFNILYLHSHDTGRYIQPYGHAVYTPNLQRLAEQGVIFRQAFCANPTCSASRAALLTGQYAHCSGMIGLAHRGFALNDYSHHLVHTLRQAGYRSYLAGIQHEAPQENGFKIIGYDEYLGEPSVAHERAAAFFRSKPRQPFFLSVGFFETHRPFPALDSSENPNHCLPPAPIPDAPETREDMARFKISARALDSKMGRVLEALEQSGLAESTLVFCTTDHGIAFPRMKCNLHDSGTGVLLIMRGPCGFSGGRAIEAMVSHIDLFPTICELLEIALPPWLNGVSIMPLIRGEKQEIRQELFSEVNYHAAYEPMRAVRTKQWKYIRRYDGRLKPVLPNCDDGPAKSLWLAHGWAGQRPAKEALFDLIYDPNEMNNLIHQPECASIAGDMRGRLERWMRETHDPLLHGPAIPMPSGAIINNPDGISPSERPKPANAK